MSVSLAPIVLFVYNRPWHTEQTLNALMQNGLANESVLYIYADGPKEGASKETLGQIEKTRQIIKSRQWCKEVHIQEKEKNHGLADSIVAGVTDIVNQYGKVIVLEDDIVTSRGFLQYMNDALSLYENDEQVMHISGYMYPYKETVLPTTFFYNVPLCWGWATWKRSWKLFKTNSLLLWQAIEKSSGWAAFDKFGSGFLKEQLAQNITGALHTWFIKWHASVFLANGYTLFPNKSLVDNIGFDNSGVHNGNTNVYRQEVLAEKVQLQKIELVEEASAGKVIKQFYDTVLHPKKNGSFASHLKSISKRIARKLFFTILPEMANASTSNVSIYNSYLGKHIQISPKARINNTLIGSYTYIAENAIIQNAIIGKFCSIGPNFLAGYGVHPTDGISTSPMFYSTKKQNGITLSKEDKVEELKQIVIGNDVFIGMNVSVLDGVTIGHGAVIGAGAVVSKDIPPYAVAVGSPIKVVKYRQPPEVIEQLLEMEWWNWDIDKLSQVEKYFFDVNSFVHEYGIAGRGDSNISSK